MLIKVLYYHIIIEYTIISEVQLKHFFKKLLLIIFRRFQISRCSKFDKLPYVFAIVDVEICVRNMGILRMAAAKPHPGASLGVRKELM